MVQTGNRMDYTRPVQSALQEGRTFDLIVVVCRIPMARPEHRASREVEGQEEPAES